MRQNRAFTLVELLIALVIIGLLLAILLPAVQAAREAARASHCRSNLRQIAIAVQSYHDGKRRLPPSNFQKELNEGPDSQAWSWLAHLLPYLEEQNLFVQGGIPRKTLRESNVADSQLDAFLCPSDHFSHLGPRTGAGNLPNKTDEEPPFPVGQTNYKGVSGANWGEDSSIKLTDIGTDWPNDGKNGSKDGQDNGDGILFRSTWQRPRSFRHVTDGLSKTFLAGENLPEKNNWCSWPYANNAHGTCAIPPNVNPVEGRDYSPSFWPNVAGFRSAHPGGVYFSYTDASVRFVADDVDLAVYRGMATIAGRETGTLP